MSTKKIGKELEGGVIEKGEIFVSLGHELSHVKSDLQKKQDRNTWYSLSGTNVEVNEIYATHVENKIRVATGMKLRRSYVGEKGTVINEKGKSLYIDKNKTYPCYPTKKIDS